MIHQSVKFPTGIWLSVEGIDGAGKSGHLLPLRDFFESHGREVLMTREPGGTPLGESLRKMILNEPMQGITEAMLSFSARAEHLHDVILPALRRDAVVLCDRFSDSTFAYQGFGRGISRDILGQIQMAVQGTRGLGLKEFGVLQPHKTLWFDVPPEVAARRLAGARAPDKFEAQQHEFFTKVAKGYAWLARNDEKRFVRIDASQSMAEVSAAVLRAADELIKVEHPKLVPHEDAFEAPLS